MREGFIIAIFREVLPEAVEDCIEAAGLLHEPEYQKQQMRAAQFGKSFLPPGGLGTGVGSADAFANMCKTLRVLNAVRNFRVGMPLTITQYRYDPSFNELRSHCSVCLKIASIKYQKLNLLFLYILICIDPLYTTTRQALTVLPNRFCVSHVTFVKDERSQYKLINS